MNSDRVVILGLISKGIRRAAGPAGRKAVKLSLDDGKSRTTISGQVPS